MSISEEEEREHREWMQHFREEVYSAEPNTFKREHGELLLWYAEESHKIDRTTEWSGGLDGEHTRKTRELFNLYRSKWRELKEKYGIEG